MNAQRRRIPGMHLRWAFIQALKVVRPAGAQHRWPARPQIEAD